jgi:hypothetical protein
MRRPNALIATAVFVWSATLALHATPAPARRAQAAGPGATALFQPSDNCMACHNGLTTPSGEDVSIGVAWRSSMMANSARDPYWQAAVRREVLDHPAAADTIEDECARCHMPMSRTAAHAAGQMGRVFQHLDAGGHPSVEDVLAADGVSCTLCHQIRPDNLGRRDSFSGGYVIDTSIPPEQRPLFGPFPIDQGRVRLMHSATGFRPEQSMHVRQSEMCATCHTLYTRALDASGRVVGELPEQMPFQEWQHSAFVRERTCQSCHMPAVAEPTRIASVLGEPRENLARHAAIGGNFFILRMLNRYRSELRVTAPAAELEHTAQATLAFLQTETARLSLVAARAAGGTLEAEVRVENLTGHKFPTAYPSRRAWIALLVRDQHGTTVFESGTLAPDGSIRGNANDADPRRYEPHYDAITDDGQVQIYESIMVDPGGAVTTGLLSALRYVKDNRITPRGFDKATAHADIAVHGAAASDANFSGGRDRVRYAVDVSGQQGPFTIEAELWYQPIGFRWAHNLKPYDAPEPKRFVAWYAAMAAGSAASIARASATIP